MFRQYLKGLLAGTLIAATVAAPVAGAADERARLNGVLVSPNSAIALIDGGMYRKGDAIGDARIVAISEGSIRVLSESGEFQIRVGSRLANLGITPTEKRSSMRIAYSRPSEQGQSQQERRLLLAAADAPRSVHTVQSGETLSEIASRYREDGVTLDQMMVGLFQSNSGAFGGNINKLYSGAELRIPARAELIGLSAVAAADEVHRQMNDTRARSVGEPVLVEKRAAPDHYGPVEGGESLSMIAAQIAPDDVTHSQVMIALFEANPEAFGGNINLLFAGTTLRIPDPGDYTLSADAATAEVKRQTMAWQDATVEPESTYAGLSAHRLTTDTASQGSFP